MRIKNAFKIVLSNVNTMYKMVLYRFICTAAFALIAYFAVLSGLKYIFYSEQFVAIRDTVTELLTDFLSGRGIADVAESMRPAFDDFFRMLYRERAHLLSALFGTFGLVLLLRFFYALGDFAFASAVDGFMSSMNKPGFFSSLLESFGKAALYALVITLVSVVSECVIFLTSLVIVVYTISYISVFAIIFGVAFLVFGFALKYSLLSPVLPSVVCDRLSVGKALKGCVRKGKDFAALLGSYSFLWLLFFYINVSFGVFTLYMGLIVSLPLTSLYFISVSLTDQYIVNHKSYYVDYNVVVSPKEKQENAEMLKYL